MDHPEWVRARGGPAPRWDLDRAGATLLRACGLVSAALVLLMLGFLAWSAWPVLGRAGEFLAATDWEPASGRYGLLSMVAGTLAVTVGAMLLSAPLGVASAVFARHYAPRPVATLQRRLVELLAGIPSVVYGFWGLVTLVPWIARWRGSGSSLLAATLVLALMVLPTVALLSDAALGAVPRDQARGAAALGMGRWAAVRRVILPAAMPGILRAWLLASMRAAGETMAVLMVAGNVVRLPGDPFAPVRTLTANMALEMGYAYGDHQAALFLSGLLLLALVAAGALLAERLERRAARWATLPREAGASRGHSSGGAAHG